MSVRVIKPNDVIEAQESIAQIESDINNNGSLVHKIFVSKRDIIRFWAECYEILIKSDKIELRVNQIATFLVKKVKALNGNIDRAYIYDSLSSKFKSFEMKVIQSEDTTNNSSLHVDYAKENKLEIEFMLSYIILLRHRINVLQKEPYYSLLEPEEYMEHYIIRSSALRLLSDSWNNRKTVSISTIHLLLQAFDQYNLKYAAGHYISLLKKFGSEKRDHSITKLNKMFSDKQLGKILRGQTRELHASMEIQTQEEAYENGFYGKVKCNECDSWRVLLQSSYNQDNKSDIPHLYCFACGVISPAPFVKLPLSSSIPRFDQEEVF